MNAHKHFNTKTLFKALFFVGCTAAFLGLFVDFYTLQGTHHTVGTVILWNYNLFTGWTTPLPDDALFNVQWKPASFDISNILQIVFMATIVISLFCIILKGLNDTTDLHKLTFYAYIHFFLLLFIGFYVFVFPLFFLAPNDLHFPIITITDEGSGIIFLYSIGQGYVMELIAFLLVFPYVIFYIQTIRTYEIEGSTQAEKILSEKVKQTQKVLDIEQQIAQEHISLEFQPIKTPQKIKNKSNSG